MIKIRYWRKAILPAAIVIVGIVLSFVLFRPTLPERLDQEIKKRFLQGASLASIEAWLKNQPVQTDEFSKIEDTIGHQNVTVLAGLREEQVGKAIRAVYHETRWLLPHKISVYFFFDHNDRLLKHWTYDAEVIP